MVAYIRSSRDYQSSHIYSLALISAKKQPNPKVWLVVMSYSIPRIANEHDSSGDTIK